MWRDGRQYIIQFPQMHKCLARWATPCPPKDGENFHVFVGGHADQVQSLINEYRQRIQTTDCAVEHVPYEELRQTFDNVRIIPHGEHSQLHHFVALDLPELDKCIRHVQVAALMLPMHWVPDHDGFVQVVDSRISAAIAALVRRRPTAQWQIQQPLLLQSFSSCKRQFRKTVAPFQVATDGEALADLLNLSHGLNEKILFHGTDPVVATAILEQGLDARLARQGLFGYGTYFAEDLNKALQYGSTVIIARVLLGRVRQISNHNPQLVRPLCVFGCVVNHCKHELCDSVCGAVPGVPREFIVYQNDLIYPEFLVDLS